NESFPREFQRSGPSAVRDVNANFTGAFAFRLDNRLHDSGFVQFTDKLFVVHVLLPASTGATPAKTSAPAGKAPAGGPASSTPATAPPTTSRRNLLGRSDDTRCPEPSDECCP